MILFFFSCKIPRHYDIFKEKKNKSQALKYKFHHSNSASHMFTALSPIKMKGKNIGYNQNNFKK